MLRERAGAPEVTLDLPDGARVRDAIDSLAGLAEGLPLVMAVNREYADEERELDPGDELALIPPVSGGETQAAPWVRVSQAPLSLEELAARGRRGHLLRRDPCGRAARVRRLRPDGRGAPGGDRHRGDRVPRPLRRRGR